MSISLTKKQLINTARSYKGYQEKRILGTREQMWDFHWAAGDKNYTIWAMLFKDYTGENYQGQAWCVMSGVVWLVLALEKYCNLSTSEAVAQAKQLLGGKLPCNCQNFVDTRKGDKRLSHTPKVGSYVIFWTGKRYGHWGLVTDVVNGGFYSIEGNTSNTYNVVVPDGGAVVEKFHANDSRTYFWDLELDECPTVNCSYVISTDSVGLRVVQVLNIRDTPGASGTKVGTYKSGEHIFPTAKTFVNHDPWYNTNKGWVSAKYLEGWVKEYDGSWWYMHKGYTYTVNNWEKINGKWYYFNDAGISLMSNWIEWKGKWYYLQADCSMATNKYIKSIDKDIYYYVDSEGVWDSTKDTHNPPKNKIVK